MKDHLVSLMIVFVGASVSLPRYSYINIAGNETKCYYINTVGSDIKGVTSDALTKTQQGVTSDAPA
jgi:hypothetical protein